MGTALIDTMNRGRVLVGHLKGWPANASVEETRMARQLRSCEEALCSAISSRGCIPQDMIQIGLLDALVGLGDAAAADGTILLIEGTRLSNLDETIGLLRPIKDAHPMVSWADVIQMARAVAIRVRGGAGVPMRYGRVDASVVTRIQSDRSRSNRIDQENIQAQVAEALAKMRSLPTSIEMLASKSELSQEFQALLAGDCDEDFSHAGRPVECKLTSALYMRNEQALLRDCALAHAEQSEVGATFTPSTGLQYY